MADEAVTFGTNGDLAGVITRAGTDRQYVGCILLNAGVIHRVGPHRINVKLARALASAGIPTLRMDLSGLGDSAMSGTSADVQTQAVRDLQEGIAMLSARAGVERILVIGICSGAVSAYALALADDRVQGLLMFDGFTFPTMLTPVVRRWRRFRMAPFGAIRAWMLNAVQPVTESKADEMATPSEQKPSRQEFAAAIERLIDRSVSVGIVYSGTILKEHSYSRQLQHAFRNARFLRQIRYSYLSKLDHTLTPLDAQRTFVTFAVDWAREAVEARRVLSAETS
jgi:dienelactone hydrolase